MASKFVFNVFTGTFDLINNEATIPSYQSEINLPVTANDGSLAVVLDTDQTYIFNLTSGLWTTTGLVIETVSTISDSNAITTDFTLDGQILRPTLTMHVADDTNSGLLTATDQTIGGIKTFKNQILTPNIDALPSGNLNIGTGNANTITIGNVSTTVIIQGTTEYQNVTNLNVADKLITINKGGSVTTGGDAGLEIEEASTITGYNKTSSDRNSWSLKAPNTAGIATITPGASGITLDQSSHNPVTIGTANGLSLSTQQISMALATDSVTGALSSTDHTRYAASATLTEAATSSATPNTLAKRDSNGYLGVVRLLDPSNLTAVELGATRNLQSVDGSPQLSWQNLGVSVNNLSPGFVVINNGSNLLRTSTTTNTELSYVSGVTSAIQTQLTNKADRNANDISLSSATLVNNQVAAANVTGLAFANANVRSAQVQYSITVATTGTSLYEEGTLRLVQRGSDWTVSRTFDGDDSLVNFDVTNAGQITYTSSNYTGFVSGTLKFRANVTTV